MQQKVYFLNDSVVSKLRVLKFLYEILSAIFVGSEYKI